jgi:nucleotide-binding universal stress UspA family protein
MKILLAVDGSDCSNAAVEEVVRRPWPAGSSIKVLCAVELPFIPTTETWALPESYYSQLEQVSREQARAAISHAVTKLQAERETPLEIQTAIINGQAKDVILDEAAAWRADLIVLGSHGYRGWQRFLLGSVSQAVVSHAPCSVEIVRSRAEVK